MKRLLLISVCLYAFVVTGLLLRRELVVNADEKKCAALNGDVNADGTIDLTDATTILGHLFLGSPTELVPLCPLCPCGLPATGQTKCFDDAGNEISCDSPDFPGQDGFYQAGWAMNECYEDNGDGTVMDTCTGLMWQKGTADVNGDGTITEEDCLTWQEALKYCENLDFAGYSDWRLPNVREIQSMIMYGHCDPAMHPVFEVVAGRDRWHWTSTTAPCAGINDYARLVDLDGGVMGSWPFPKSSRTWFRAVR